MGTLDIAGIVIIAAASNTLIDTGAPIVTNLLVRGTARLRYHKNPARAEVRREELLALIDERQGRLRKLATSLGIFAWTAADLFFGALGRQLRVRSSLISSIFIIAGIAVTIVLAVTTRNSTLWWILSASLLLLWAFVPFSTRYLQAETPVSSLVEMLAASVTRALGSLDVRTSALVNIPFRFSLVADTEHLSVGEFIANGSSQRRLAIIGSPGAGKTSLLYELAQQLLEHAKSDAHPRLPIVLHARDWDLSDSLTKWLTMELSQRFLLKGSTAYRLVLQGGVLLLLDGLDEIPHDSQRDAARLLDDGLNGCRTLSAAITCRTTDFESLSPLMPGFTIVSVLPLSDSDIGSFLSQLPSEVDSSLIERALDSDPSLREAARNPLLLRLLTYALSFRDIDSASSSDPIWSALVLGDDFERRGDLEDALNACLAARSWRNVGSATRDGERQHDFAE